MTNGWSPTPRSCRSSTSPRPLRWRPSESACSSTRTSFTTPLSACSHSVPQTSSFNPTAVRLQLHLPLRDGGFGITKFSPEACAAAVLSSAIHAATALSTAAPHLHPFAAPHNSVYAWLHIVSRCPDVCPPLADGLFVPTTARLAQLPTNLCSAINAMAHAKLKRLGPTDQAQARLGCISTRSSSMWPGRSP
jgi:hypothetical protein